MEIFYGLLILTPVHMLAAASPGPDFILVTQQTLTKGKKAGIYCSAGVALGQGIHILYSIFGLAVMIANSASALTAVKISGGLYLIYLGYKGLNSTPGDSDETGNTEIQDSLSTVRAGFICNVFNPKAPVYFVSLFTLILSPDMPILHLIIFGLWIIALQFIWFASLSILLSAGKIQSFFKRFKHRIDRTFGALMIILGIKVISSD